VNADRITIETDDRGFYMVIDLDEDVCTHGQKNATVIVNIHAIADELYEEVKKEIGPWLYEMQQAKAEYDTGRANDPTQQAVLDRIKRDPYEDDDGPWPGESVMSFYQRTGQDGPLRETADLLNKARKENQ